VLGVVEDQHVGGGRLGGDDAGVLGHVARAVHLALVVDLDLDLNLPADRAEAAELWGGGGGRRAGREGEEEGER